MDWYMFFIVIMLLIFVVPSLVIIIKSFYIQEEYRITTIEDEEETKKLISDFSKSAIFETVNINEQKEERVEVVKLLKYKINPKDPKYKEKQSELIIKIIYYKKL